MNNIPTATIATINLNQLKEVPRLEPDLATVTARVATTPLDSPCSVTVGSLSVFVS
jgi:hypothetical protein